MLTMTKTVERVKTTVTRFDSAQAEHSDSFGFGVEPADWDSLAQEHGWHDDAPMRRDENEAEQVTFEVAAPIVVAPIVTDFDPIKVGQLNARLHAWSLKNRPSNDENETEWNAFLSAYNAESDRLKLEIWPQPKRIEKGQKPPKKGIYYVKASLPVFDESDMDDWKFTKALKRA